MQKNLIRGFDISTMATKSGSLDYWRKYFRCTNSDIFEVIEYAIMLAAADCPNEFKNRRDRIAEKLYTCIYTRCSGCDHVELPVPGEEEGDDLGCKTSGNFVGSVEKESKVNSSTTDNADKDMKGVTNYSYDEAEALTEEIEEENQIVGEVLRIKDIFVNSQDQSDAILYESLRRLQLMALTVDTLKATEIGKAVNGIRKNNNKKIRQLARTLIDGWKDLVDEWVNATAAAAAVTGTTDASPDSVNPSVVVDDEEGLPSPPLDEGAFFTTQTTSMELSQFFDGMDDDGNPRNNGEFEKKKENGRKTTTESYKNADRVLLLPNESNIPTKDSKAQPVRKPEAVLKQMKPSNTESGPGRPPKQSSVPKSNSETKFQQKMEIKGIQRRPGQQDKPKSSDENSVRAKLEAAKRKLQEGYQQAENAKKQRTIQVMELCDLPKQGLGHKPSPLGKPGKPGNQNRHWANGRR